MIDILHTVLPLYLLIAIGAVLRLAVADDNWIEVFNKFGLYLGFPAIVFTSLRKIPEGGMLEFRAVACNVALLLAAIFLTYFIARFLRLSTSMRNTYVTCVFFGNVAYLGYPFVTSVMSGSEASASIHIAIYVTLLFTIGVVILELSKGRAAGSLLSVATNIIKSPLLLSVVAGFVFRSADWKLPAAATKTIDLLAACGGPIVLLAIGMFIVRRLAFDRSLLHAALLSSLKLIALPLTFILFARFSSPIDGFAVSIIDAGMPAGITAFALAEIYPIEKQVVASMIVLSTILSAVTLPILASCVL